MIFGNELQNDWQAKASILQLQDVGTTLVIAPHPDDESLGCGGLIALLRQAKFNVHVAFISDGSMSHPNSKKYPTEKLIMQRENEAIHALRNLGVDEQSQTFLRFKDTAVPTVGQRGFEEAVYSMVDMLNKIQPQTILVPWEKDPHVDHRASWNIVHEAVKQFNNPPKILQYFIWLWELGKEADLPMLDKIKWYKINIETVVDLKQKAIAAHISQTTNLIDDDAEGFTLSPKVLNYFNNPFELFAETI